MAVSFNILKFLVETILQFEQDYQRDKVPPKSHMFFTSTTWDFFRIDNLPHLAACFRDYVTNPKIVGLAEYAVGAVYDWSSQMLIFADET